MSRSHFSAKRALMLALTIVFSLIGLALPDNANPVHASSTWYVATGGLDASCSIAQPCATIQHAVNRASSGDTIEVGAGTFYANTGSESVLIPASLSSLTLAGGWNGTFTAQTGFTTITGLSARRGITVNGGPTFIDHVILTGGQAVNGAGLQVNAHTLLSYSTVQGNVAIGAGASGGGIQVSNITALSVVNVTITGNTADSASGGRGGGIAISSGSSINLFNATIAQNSAYQGGGISNSATGLVGLRDTLLAANTSSTGSDDCDGTLTSQTYNLIGVVGATCIFTAGTGDQVGSSGAPINPSLDSLQYGTVLPLRADSPAINGGDPNGCLDARSHVLTDDEISQPRLGRCDIGAYELQIPFATSTPTPSIPPTASSTATATPTGTLSPTTPTFTFTPSATPTTTATSTPSATPTNSPAPISLLPETVGIYDPNDGVFFLRQSNTTGFANLTFYFGGSDKYPVAGDWTNSGFDTVGVYDQTNGLFSLRYMNLSGAPDVQFVLGNPGDQPLAGRWQHGASHDGVGVFRPSNGLIYLKNEFTTGYADYTMVLGNPGDVGLSGDWTGNGIDSPGVYRPNEGRFFASNQVCTCAVYGDYMAVFGPAQVRPFVGDWLGSGQSNPGVFVPGTTQVFLRNTFTTGYGDTLIVFGMPSGIPLAGRWLVPPPAPPQRVLIPAPSNATRPPVAPPTAAAAVHD